MTHRINQRNQSAFRGTKLNGKEFARYIDVHPSTLAHWRMRGYPHIPYYLIGGRYWYDSADGDDWLKRHRINDASEVV